MPRHLTELDIPGLVGPIGGVAFADTFPAQTIPVGGSRVVTFQDPIPSNYGEWGDWSPSIELDPTDNTNIKVTTAGVYSFYVETTYSGMTAGASLGAELAHPAVFNNVRAFSKYDSADNYTATTRLSFPAFYFDANSIFNLLVRVQNGGAGPLTLTKALVIVTKWS